MSLERDGYVTLRAVYAREEAAELLASLEEGLARGAAILRAEGAVYAARNVLAAWPRAAEVVRRGPLREALVAALGPGFGLVRGLYFDKPPGQSWALPWHKDMTVAVRDNRLPSAHFAKPTVKAGVPHVEAPVWLLERMLTARLHLDDVTDENGPLKVVPGSHRTGEEMRLEGAAVATLHAEAGDVLLMRPLLAHCSNRSREGTARHRRVLHLELAADAALPDGFAWHTFLPGS
jgi:ectoine hydroxylase-related dioxygenase (phytanoyl-CoA dioxygenase family)